MATSTERAIPAGMKPWHGNGPNDHTAPDDYDGGPILYRIGQAAATLDNCYDGERGDWRSAEWQRDYASFHIIAYTPRQQPAANGDWVLVPREPTEAMISAAMETPGMKAVNAMIGIQAARGYPLPESAFPNHVAPLSQAWSAMLAAAPSPTVKDERGESMAMRALRLVAEHDTVMAHLEPDAHDAILAALTSPAPKAATDAVREEGWAPLCGIESCWRHGKCMYSPCRAALAQDGERR